MTDASQIRHVRQKINAATSRAAHGATYDAFNGMVSRPTQDMTDIPTDNLDNTTFSALLDATEWAARKDTP